jgi:hypothetical protein
MVFEMGMAPNRLTVGNFNLHLDDLRQHEAHRHDQRHHRE